MAAKVTNGSGITVTGTGAGQKVNQVINGGNGADVINASSLFAADSTGTHTIIAGNGADVVNGSAFAEIIWGDSSGSSQTSDNGADTLNGGAGDDQIHGGNGSDHISGDLGADTLWGDRGGDIFKYKYNSDSSALAGAFNIPTGDWIRDFRGSEGDKLDFSALHGNGQFSGATPPDELQWSGNTASPYGIWWVQSGGDTYVYADTSGDGVADIAIKVAGLVNFTPGNFLGINRAPTAIDDVNSVLEDSSVAGTVANDSDPDGDTLSFALNAPVAGLTLLANGSYTFDASHAAYQHLAAGVTEDVIATYTVSDGHGGSDTATLTITVTGVNDAASISGDNVGDVVEDGIASDSGVLAVDDLDDGEEVFQVAAALDLDGVYGDFTFNELTGAWGFTIDNAAAQGLGQDDEAYETLLVTSADGTASETITVTVTGVNDAASISGDNEGDVVEDGTASDSGVLAVDDADDGEEVFQVAAALDLAGVYGDFTFDETTGAWGFTIDNAAAQGLGQGEEVDETLLVTSADGTATETITVTVTGVNDAADIGGDDSGAVTEDGTLVATGTLTIDDDDGADEETFQASVQAGVYGSLDLAADGSWTYTLDNDDDDLDDLDAGESDDEVFTITSLDGTTHDVTVTVNGANEASAYSPPPVYTGGGDPNDFDTVPGGGSEDATIHGDDENNVLIGGTTNQNIDGKSGNDTIYGGGGSDDIAGNGGDDTLYGQPGDDDIAGDNQNDLIYGGSGNDEIAAGNGTDTVYGGSGNDDITGAGDADVIVGGYGADTLSGGGGNDTFRYLSNLDTGDTISDFALGDKIDLVAFAPSSFVGLLASAGAVGANQVGYMSSGGVTTIYVDTNGVFGADMEIYLSNGYAPLATDFIFS